MDPTKDIIQNLPNSLNSLDSNDYKISVNKIVYELKRENLNLNNLINNIPAGIVCYVNNDTLSLLYINDTFTSMLGYSIKDINDKFDNSLLDLIHPEDRDMVLSYSQNNSTKKIEYRLINKQGYDFWVLDAGQAFLQEDNTKVFCSVLINIDSIKKESQSLLKKSEEDALTGLYNKATSQSMIQEYIVNCAENEVCSVMILDIDNFKTVNDTLGHLFGDTILTDISRELKNCFNDTEIVGRIGGDEFIVFVKDIKNINDYLPKVNTIINSIGNLNALKDKQCKISCSIGISIFSKDGVAFPALYKKADQALYQAKREGKNRYILYNENVKQEFLENNIVHRSVINEKIDSNKGIKKLSGQLVEYAFRILYNSIDIKTAIQAILEIVGIQFDVSRVYIFENTEDDKYSSNTFEWCNKDIEPQIHMLQNVCYDELCKNYLNNFNEEGIFYCKDIKSLPSDEYNLLSPQGIKSMLQCAINYKGTMKGFVGFDECTKNRYWTQEQIDTLTFISEILSTFLIRTRIDEQLNQQSLELMDILNNQNSWIYIIEPDTYTLLFINKKTTLIVPTAQIGTTCYKAFFNRTSPCEICPAKGIHKDCKNQTLEIYNPNLNVWTDADACYIKWKEKDAILLTCHDITRLKK